MPPNPYRDRPVRTATAPYVAQEMLKNREARGRGGGAKASAVNRSALNSSFRDNNKRYLILTYAAAAAYSLLPPCSRRLRG